jgi:putative CocE/NonD family hydrolase
MDTRDGVRLWADVYLPAGNGPFPTLLYRVRGSKDSAFITGTLMLNPIVAADRGYAVVVQQVRGRGSSEGEWHPFIYEAEDGLDAVEWTLQQPWCDGSIGVYGSAYAGATALQITATGHPAVKACVAFVTGANYYDGWIYTSGAFELGWDNFWAYLTAGESLQRLEVDETRRAALAEALEPAFKDPMAQMERLPLRDQPALDEISPHYWTWLDHPTYDEYWQRLDVVPRADRITAAVLNITGWWDNFLGSHIQLYDALRDRSPAGENQRLVIGPWDHFTYVGVVPTAAGDRDFGPKGLAGNPVVGPMTLDWVDRLLRDGAATAATAPGVRYFMCGPDRWVDEGAWPPPARTSRYHLRSSGGANSSSGDGTLSLDGPGPGEPADRYRYDPADPVPTVGGRTLMPTVVAAGIRDQSTVAERDDVLVYTSEALDEALDIAGSVRVELWASTSAVDTDFTAKLVDVGPDGYCSIVADGIIRARHRGTYEDADWLTPGEVYGLEIALWGAAWRFDAGHHIRLEVASSNFPRFDRHLNIKAWPGSASLDEAVVAEQTVYHDEARPSALILPVAVTPDA